MILVVTEMSWEMTVVPLSHSDGGTPTTFGVRKLLARGFSVLISGGFEGK